MLPKLESLVNHASANIYKRIGQLSDMHFSDASFSKLYEKEEKLYAELSALMPKEAEPLLLEHYNAMIEIIAAQQDYFYVTGLAESSIFIRLLMKIA